MQTLLHASLRMVVSMLMSVGIWWLGGGSLIQDDPGAQITNLWLLLLMSVGWFVLLGMPFVSWAGNFVGKLFIPSDESFELRPQYSIPEARVKEGRYDEAIKAFRAYTVQYPGEIYPHVRIADLQLEKLGDPQAAIAELQIAVSKARIPDAFSMVSFRLADLHVLQGGNTQAALTCLREVQSRYPASQHARSALERAERLLMQ